MRNSKEISAELEARMKALETAADADRATMASEIDNLTRELQDAQIDEAARRALANQRTFSGKDEQDARRFSWSKFLRQSVAGNLDGVEAEMDAEGKREMRASLGSEGNGTHLPSALLRLTWNNVTTATEGQEFAHVTKMSFDEALHKTMVCGGLGVQYMDGLQGNVAIVKGGSATAAWYAEEGAAAAQKIAYSLGTLKPKRVAATAGYSYDILHQSSLQVDQLIQDELVKSIASALDEAVLSGASNGPAGIVGAEGINEVAAGSAAPTFAKLVEMETLVGVKNALRGALAYVFSSKVAGALKTAPQIAGYPLYLLQNGMVNGYKAAVTNEVADTTGLFGNFNEVLVGGWGGLNIIVDPYSQKTKGIIEVTVNKYHDVLVRRPEAFTKMTGIKIA